jgi:hypothetical protein
LAEAQLPPFFMGMALNLHDLFALRHQALNFRHSVAGFSSQNPQPMPENCQAFGAALSAGFDSFQAWITELHCARPG